MLPGLAWLSGRPGASRFDRRTTLWVATAGYLGALAGALVAGATGLTPVSLTGRLLGGPVLVSALVMASAGLLGGRPEPGRMPVG